MSHQSANEISPLGVLLVEDNEADVVWLQRLLQEANFEHNMFVANDGESAIRFLTKWGEYASAFDPDLVLLDVNLPKISGIEVLDAIQTDPKLRGIPLCIVTGSEPERDFIIRRYQIDVRCYVLKPITASAFGEALGSYERLKFYHGLWRRLA
jgi:chemotaxis family two-component system response regulator Rcp1